jgi:hypothetical protein
LQHYRHLADTHGMQSHCMADFAPATSTGSDAWGQP